MDGMTRSELARILEGGAPVILLDVRTAAEFADGTVAGARNVAPDRLAEEVASLPPDATVVTVCNHGGQRSQGAAARLRDLGIPSATFLVGGVKGPRPGH